MPMTHELIVDSVVVRFGEKTVVSGGYVTARTGSVTGLLGRNGAGKSCMFRALMGGLKVDYVSVHADGKSVDIGKIGLTVKYLPQGRMIPDGLTLKQAFQLYQVDFWAFVLLFPKYSGKYHARLWEMSGGEARRAAKKASLSRITTTKPYRQSPTSSSSCPTAIPIRSKAGMTSYGTDICFRSSLGNSPGNAYFCEKRNLFS